MAQFITDRNLPDFIANWLSNEGHEVTKLRHLPLSHRAKDEVVIQEIKRRGYIFVTCDKDFGDPNKFPPEDFGGILILRIDKEDARERCKRVWKQLTLLLKQVSNFRGRVYRITKARHERLDIPRKKKKRRS